MGSVGSVDVTDPATFGRVPPCADPRFDHRTCDYWEDADRGSKLARPAWLTAPAPRSGPPRRADLVDNPFAPPPKPLTANPFAPGAEDPFAPGPRHVQTADPFASLDDLPSTAPADDPFAPVIDNPFAPRDARPRPLREGVPRKLALLDRGRGVFGSYGKILLVDDEPVAYAQFGPLSAYPRAGRLRELYPQLPDSPLPAVITCISTTAQARREGHGGRLVQAVCDDLAERGFAAVEAYPDLTRDEDETSAGRPAFWHACGFETAVDDERFPVMRRDL